MRVAGLGRFSRCEHRHTVALSLRQRYRDEEVRRPVLIGPDGEDGKSARHIPVDHDVAEHEFHRELVAGEADACRLADSAVRSIAADDIAELRTLDSPAAVPELDVHAAAIIAKAVERHSPLHVHANASKMLGEDPLGLVLRNAQVTVRQVGEVRNDVVRRLARDDHAQPFEP